MPSIIFEGSAPGEPHYRVVWEYSDPDRGFTCERKDYDALGEPSWRAIDLDNIHSVRKVLFTLCHHLAERSRAK